MILDPFDIELGILDAETSARWEAHVARHSPRRKPVTTTTINGAQRDTASFVQDRRPFSAGGRRYGFPNFSGKPLNPGEQPGSGRLEGDSLLRFQRDLATERMTYVILSYATPIAWLVDDFNTGPTWFLVPEKFSSSTGRHQSAAASIARESGHRVWGEEN